MRRNWRRLPSTKTIALSPRQFVARAALVLMMIASITLISLSRSNHPAAQVIHASVADATAPLLDLLSRPGAKISEFQTWLESLVAIHAQNQQLRSANTKLMQWQQVALQLEAENAALRELMNYTSSMPYSLITAKVVGDRSGAMARTAMINAGTTHGIATGQALINNKGLVGRVVNTGEQSARILLLTDINSRVPVISESSRERAIAAGTNGETLRLLYVADNSKIAVGELIFTSGDGETVPSGLPVGKVTEISNGVITISPLADWHHIDYVSALANSKPSNRP